MLAPSVDAPFVPPGVTGHEANKYALRNFGTARRVNKPNKPSATMTSGGEVPGSDAPFVPTSAAKGSGAYAALLDHELPKEAPSPCGLSLASFFCGCGGVDLGFRSAGFELAFANDIWERAAQSCGANLGHAPIVRDIRQVSAADVGRQVDVLTAGFPCVSFSTAGQRMGVVDDVNGKLYLQVCRVISEVKPRYFVAENVRGMLSANGGNAVKLVLAAFLRLGYRTSYELVNMAEHGVPQTRERVIFVGVRIDQWRGSFLFPARTHRLRADKKAARWLPVARSLRDAIGDLPQPDEKLLGATGGENAYIVRAALEGRPPMSNRDARKVRGADEPCVVPTSIHPSHVFVAQMHGDAARKIAKRKRGESAGTFQNSMPRSMDEPGHSVVSFEPNVVAARNSCYTNNPLRTSAEPSVVVASSAPPQLAMNHVRNDANVSNAHAMTKRVARDSKPSPTIVAETRNVQPMIESLGYRRMTVRETARVQSFPDWYEFAGSQIDGYRQTGNAVPPLYAKRLAQAIIDYDTRK